VLANFFGESEPEQETSHVVRTALEQMGSLGAEIVEIDFQGLEELLAQTSTIDLEFKWDLLDYLARTPNTPVGSLSEIIERGLHHDALGEILRRSDRHVSRDSAAMQATLARRNELRTAVLELLEEERLDALAYPSLRREVARIGEPALGNNCQLSAATGMPALGIPAGFSSSGAPIGMELLGPPFSDAHLLSLGYAYEQAVAPRRPPALTPALLP
jgi:Asp-tRNA(Asn)/Glu-tRNA(Gln) amidotransferase A subunit family amidase